MTATFQRFFSAGVLTLWGVVLSYFYFSGKVGSYLHPSFHIWMAVSGIVLVLMAAGLIFLPVAEDTCSPGECVHVPGGKSLPGAVLSAFILTVPLLVTALVSPGQFGATAVLNRGYADDIAALPGYKPYVEPALPTEDGSPGAVSQQSEPAADYLPRTKDGAIKAQTVDLLYAAAEPSMREDFENQKVELIGQFMPAKSNNASGDRFNLVRMFVNCCAADSRPVAVTIQSAKPEKLPEMSWIKVTGQATFPVEAGRHTAVVVAESVTPVDPPPETFIY